MMEYFLAGDCGGSKCTFMLCDTSGQVHAALTGGTGNSNFESAEAIVAKLADLLSRLREQSGVDPARVTAWGAVLMVSADLLRPEVERLFPNCRRYFPYTEAPVNLLASAGAETGFLAHSGTGSFAACFQDGVELHYGGLGSYLGDEGSGYDVGIRTFDAVKRSLVDLGPATSMTELLLRRWDIAPGEKPGDTLWRMARQCLSVTPESRRKISGLSYVAAEAAAQGDAAAVEVLHGAAYAMFEHIHALVRAYGARPEGILTLSGGTWRCGPAFRDHFVRLTTEAYPGLRYVAPAREPVAGVASAILRDAYGIPLAEQDLSHLPVCGL